MTSLARLKGALPDGADVLAVATYTAYNPEVIAGVLAAALGAGAIGGSGGGAAGVAVDQVMSWGSHARERLLPLPHRVLAVVRLDSLSLYEWQGRRRLEHLHDDGRPTPVKT
ncbi:MAG: hypothetical protein ACJ71T_02520 [Actinomycetales bacterium]